MKKYILLIACVSGFITNMYGQITFDCNAVQYYDWDGDGFGDINYPHNPQNPNQYQYFTPSYAILLKDNKVCNAADCDDTDPLINPDTYWATIVDGDNDDHYTITNVVQGCDNIPQGAVMIDINNTANLLIDCDDTNPNVQAFKAFYRDIDGDNLGDIEDVIYSCAGTVPAGYVENGGDWCPDIFGAYNGCPQNIQQTTINQSKNYVHSAAFQKPTQLQDVNAVAAHDKLEQVTYFDGLGRTQMQIAIGQSPTNNRDIKTVVTYDEFGRAANNFLPYVPNERGGGFTDPHLSDVSNDVIGIGEVRKQQQFYHNKYPQDVTSANNGNGFLTVLDGVANLPQDLRTILDEITIRGALNPSYSAKAFDQIDRVIEQAAPGEDWSLSKQHTIKMSYQHNDSLVDAVKRFDVAHPSGNSENISLVYTNTYYPTGSLYKTITKDENWKPNQQFEKDHTSEEFKNKEGEVLLKRTYNSGVAHETYYVYDTFGNLTYVLPPKAMTQPSINATTLDQFCYSYTYDYRNRLIEKKIPGKDWEYIVYDKLDRPILTQDVNLRNNKQWLFTKYDGLGRPVYTGIYSSNASRANLQNTATTSSNTLFETKKTSSILIGDTAVFYSNDAFPSTGLQVLTINYYDNYWWDTFNSYELNYNLNGNDGITTTGNRHEKTAGLPVSWTNAGFDTEGMIQGDGYIQYTITQTDKRIMVGLSHEANAEDIHYTSINYRIYTGYGTNKRVYAYKDQTLEYFPAIYCEIGDTFRIERSGNQILYKKNGVTFHAVTTDYKGTLVGDASFCDAGTAIENVYIGYGTMGQSFTQNTQGLTTGSKVRVLGTNNWITTMSYYDEKGRTIHTSSKNDYLKTKDAISSSIDFTGKVLKTIATHYFDRNAPIITTDDFVYDDRNRLLYQTKQINDEEKELISRNHYDELGQLIQKQVGGTLPNTSTYVQMNNMTNIDGILTKTTANEWDAGVSTANTITGDGYISYTMPQSTKISIIGLSEVMGDNGFTSIKYGIYTSSTGALHIRENNSTIWNVSRYLGGDELKVERRGTTIYYLKNNVIFYTSPIVDNGAPLLGDAALYHKYTKVKNLVLIDLEKELQEVDYTYNVRGWLKGINDVTQQGNDLFSFALTYSDIADPTKQLFNGNISSTLWRSKGQDSSLKDYIYDYDALNRITRAVDNTGKYNLDEVVYDVNGNIIRLQRSGHRNEAATQFGVMDQLVYAYEGNQLQRVTDHVNIDYGFKDGINTGDDYSYDDNGNMIEDKNKEIKNIAYNHLNLPTQITFDNGSTISYIYDATGVKLKKLVTDNRLSEDALTYYAGNYVYNRAASRGAGIKLTFFNTEVGYVEPIYELTSGQLGGGLFGNTPSVEVLSSFEYTYQYKDHLGNIRLAYQDINDDGNIDPLTEIKEENHYYPFGLQHKGYNNVINGTQNNYQTYNGKELNESLGLNVIEMDFRMYDPAIGRFTGIDPITHYSMSPYVAFDNNPVFWADPTGADAEMPDWLRDIWNNSSGGFTQYTNTGNGFEQTAHASDEDIKNGKAILIAFPDQNPKIPENQKTARKLEEWFGDGDEKMNGAGHAGIVIIDGDTGGTRYFDFGRYSIPGKGGVPTDQGAVRSSKTFSGLAIPDWDSSKTDEQNVSIIVTALHKSPVFKGYGTIMGTLAEGLDYKAMYKYATEMEKKGYQAFGGYHTSTKQGNATYCAKFARGVAEAGGFDWSWYVLTGKANVEDVNRTNKNGIKTIKD